MRISSKIEKELAYVNLNKTIEKFGEPRIMRDRVVSSCGCGKKSQVTIAQIRKAIKVHGDYACKSCRNKAKWKNHEFRKRASQISKKLWQDPEYKSKKSQISKEQWKFEQFINIPKTTETFGPIANCKSKIYLVCGCGKEWTSCIDHLMRTLKKSDAILCKSCRMKIKWKSDGKFANEISDSTKESWKNLSYRKKVAIGFQKSLNNGLREKISKNSKKLWQDPEYKEKQSSTSRKLWQDQNYRAKFEKLWDDPAFKGRMSNISSKVWNNSVFREKQSKRLNELRKNGIDSILERTVQQLLSDINIKFVRHYRIGYYEFDLFIPSHSLLIECQGEYWHSFTKNKSRDAAKLTYVNEYYPNFKILYLYERDFLNPEIIKQKLIQNLFHDFKFSDQQVNFSFSDLEIRSLSTKNKLPNSYYSAPEEFLQSFHYAGFGRNLSKLLFGAYLGDKLIAVCKFSSVVKKKAVAPTDLKTSEVLELDRFCIHPSYQKNNFDSWFISYCSESVFKEIDGIKLLISSTDTTFSHLDTAYKEAGWEIVESADPSYHYISSDGYPIHKKTFLDYAKCMKKTEKEYAKEYGYTKITGKEKTKFILKLS